MQVQMLGRGDGKEGGKQEEGRREGERSKPRIRVPHVTTREFGPRVRLLDFSFHLQNATLFFLPHKTTQPNSKQTNAVL